MQHFDRVRHIHLRLAGYAKVYKLTSVASPRMHGASAAIDALDHRVDIGVVQERLGYAELGPTMHTPSARVKYR